MIIPLENFTAATSGVGHLSNFSLLPIKVLIDIFK